MRSIRRCVLLIPLLSVDPILAGRTGTEFDVTATWPRAVVPADRARLVAVDCGTEDVITVTGEF